MTMVSSSNLLMTSCLLPPLSFCSLLQVNLKQHMFPQCWNCPYTFTNIVYPGTFPCNKTTCHFYKNQGWLDKGLSERGKEKSGSRDVCWKCCYSSQTQLIGLHNFWLRCSSGWESTGQGAGRDGITATCGKTLSLCYRQLEMYRGSSALGNPAFPFASASPPAFSAAWLFSSCDHTHDVEFLRQLRHV